MLTYNNGEKINIGDVVEFTYKSDKGKAKISKVGGLIVHIEADNKKFYIAPTFLTRIQTN